MQQNGKLCDTAAPALPPPAGSKGSYLPMERAAMGVHPNCPCNLGTRSTHKVVTASREKRAPHSSHPHRLSSCNVIAIYVLTTPTIPGQQTCGR